MLAFLDEHFRPDIVGRKRHTNSYQPATDLKYARMECGIGADSPSEYINTLLHWIALRVGRKRVFKCYNIDRPVPWINEDNQRSRPVLLRSEWSSDEWGVVDEHGFGSFESRYGIEEGDPVFDRLAKLFSARDKLISAEMKRLSALWDSRGSTR